MRDAPDPPCKGAAQLDAAEIDNRLALADLRQAAGMLVTERRDFAAAQPRLDRFGDITSLLFGRRCDARDRLPSGSLIATVSPIAKYRDDRHGEVG